VKNRSRRCRAPTALSNRAVLTRISRREKDAWIDWCPLDHHLEMQVVSGRTAAGAFVSERLANDDVGIVRRGEPFEMPIEKREITADKLTVCTQTAGPARWVSACDRSTLFLMECPSSHRHHRRRRRADNVDSGVRMLPSSVTEPLTRIEPWAGHWQANYRIGLRDA